MPLAIKITRPDLAITSGSESGALVTNQTSYQLKGITGASTQQLKLQNTFDSTLQDITSLVQADGAFQVEVPLTAGQNMIRLTAIDAAGNQRQKEQLITTSKGWQNELVSFENISVTGSTLVGVGNPSYDSDKKEYTIKGRLREAVDRFQLNGVEVAYDADDLSFSVPVVLKQGKQSISCYIQADHLNQGQPLLNEGYSLIVDTVLPTLQMESGTIDEEGKYHIYTNQNPYMLQGSISDNFSGYKLFVNMDNVYSNPYYSVFDEAFFAGKPAAEFKQEISLTGAENIIQVGLLDRMGNLATKEITVHYKETGLETPSVTANTTQLTNKGVILSATVLNAEAEIYYSLDDEDFELYQTPIAITQNQDVYFKAVDKYGNFSEVTSYSVTNILQEIAARPILKRVQQTAKGTMMVSLGFQRELTVAEQEYTHLRYSLDKGATFNEYSEPFELSKTTELFMESYDDAGNQSEGVQAVIVVPEIAVEEESKNDELLPPPTAGLGEEQADDKLENEAPIQGQVARSEKPEERLLYLNVEASKNGKSLPQTSEEHTTLAYVAAHLILLAVSLWFFSFKFDRKS